jgi:hypothetical protein
MLNEIQVGKMAWLAAAASFSRVGFSLLVKIVKIHPRPKGVRVYKQEVEVRLPDNSTIIVWAQDLYEA